MKLMLENPWTGASVERDTDTMDTESLQAIANSLLVRGDARNATRKRCLGIIRMAYNKGMEINDVKAVSAAFLS